MSLDAPIILRGTDVSDLPVATMVAPRERRSSQGDPILGGRRYDDVPTETPIQETDAFAKGFAAGRAVAEADGVAEVASAVRALEAAAATADQARQQWHDQVPAQAVPLALKIAELVLMHEVQIDGGAGVLQRCFAEVGSSEPAVVRMNPSDIDSLADEDLVRGRPIEIVADPGIAVGDAIAHFDGGSIDATVSSALQRIAEVLR